MRLFSGLRHSKPTWQYRAGGQVWKLLTAGDALLGDARDVENHTASFFALDVQTGKPLWERVTLSQAWWIGMHHVIGDTLLLHGFEKPDMPIPKGIYALDLTTGRARWQDEELTYLFTANDRVYAQRASFREKTFAEIDSRTGAVIHDYGTDEDGIMRLRSVAGDAADDPGSVFAESLSTRTDAVRATVERAIDLADARGAVDVAETEKLLVVAYHLPAKGADAMLNNRVSNHLKVIAADGAVVFEDTLVADAPAPVPDVFFIRRGVLLYVKEGRRVTGVRLADLAR